MDVVKCERCGSGVIELEGYADDPTDEMHVMRVDPVPEMKVIFVEQTDFLTLKTGDGEPVGREWTAWTLHDRTCTGLEVAEEAIPIINSESLAGAFS